MSDPLPDDLVAAIDAARTEAFAMMRDDRSRAIALAHRVLAQLGYHPPATKLAMAIAAYLSEIPKSEE